MRKTEATVAEDYYSKIGDVIIPTSGETAEDIATATCVMKPGVILAGDLCIMRPSKIDGRFLSYTINHKAKYDIARIAQGKSVVHIRPEEVEQVKVCYPGKPEQEKILNFIELLQQKIEKQKVLIDSLKLYKRGASNILFSEIETSCEEWLPLQELFAVVPDKKYQVQTNQYFADGAFEVVDQGKNDIVGFNNDETKLFNDIPVIVYGDHTTIVKYRRKPFVVGGDGVKLLKPKPGFNPQYLYFALCHYNIKQEGYKRHFSILKEISLPIPLIDTQISTKNLLDGIEKKIAAEELLLTNLTEIKSGLLQQMFI